MGNDTNKRDDGYWDLIIKPRRGLFDIQLHEIVEYRDLFYMFIKREFVTLYKQTIMGPLWLILQPLITMLVFMVIFNKVARISTDGLPSSVFYLSGIIVWYFFANSLNKTSNIFVQNANIYGKVYFPRILIPLARVVFGLVSFCIQLAVFLSVLVYLYFSGDEISPNIYILLTPFLVVMAGLIALGSGLLISALTTTYRDLGFLVSFGVQLLMFATPVFYPMSIIPEQYRSLIAWNPIAHIIEGFRYAFMGTGEITLAGVLYVVIFTIFILSIGLICFNRVEQNFMDTV